MKNLLLMAAIFSATICSAQPGRLDTTKVYNITLKASEIAYAISYFNGASDSSTIKLIRDIRTKVKTYNNPTWNTNMVIDSLPGVAVMRLYEIAINIPKGESEVLGNGILTGIRAINHPVISYYVGVIDARHQSEFIRHRDLGKNMLLDN